jgi:Domain of unknown function (DUF4407)
MAKHIKQFVGRVPHLFEWLAGADARVLETAPSEVGFFRGLGMWVAGMALVSGFAMSVAAAEWWNTTILHVIWIAPIWAVLYALIERLVLKSFGTSHIWNAVLTLPRLALACFVALVVGLPMAQVIYSRSIDDQLSQTASVRTQQATHNVESFYGPKIRAARNDIAVRQANEQRLRAAVTNYTFLSRCESGEVRCSQTHELGCGPYCRRDASLAAAARAQLTSNKAADASAIATDHVNIALWQRAEQTQINERTTSIKSDRDFLARQSALNQVEAKRPAVRKYVDFFLAFLVSLDLVAITVKLMHLFSTGGAYEANAAGQRELDAVESHRLREHVLVLKRRISEQARADEEVDVARIHAERDRRIEEEEAKSAEWSGSPRTRAERVIAHSLSEYTGRSRSHESLPVSIPRGLRLAGWIGTVLVIALTAVLGLYTSGAGGFIAGEWIAIVVSVAAVGLAAYTRGFHLAPRWALRATFLTLLVGLLLPVFLLVTNL